MSSWQHLHNFMTDISSTPEMGKHSQTPLVSVYILCQVYFIDQSRIQKGATD
jgi:hypothetical protein